jgi:hypothetical protein
LKESLGKPPIPCHVFNQEMQLALSNRNNVGVYHTGKKVVERLIRQYVKPKQDGFTQTESLKQLTAKYEIKISEQSSKLIMLEDENLRSSKECS